MPINQFAKIKNKKNAWQSELISGIETSADFTRSYPLNRDESEACHRLSAQFPILIPPKYRELINWDNTDDPLRRLLVPSHQELIEDGYADTSGEQQSIIIQGLQHKYAQTAALLTTRTCAGHCRFCFRRRLFDTHEFKRETIEDLEDAFSYIKSHTEIDNILLTGGDPLLCNTRRLEKMFRAASQLPHIHSIRISTKLPAFLPSRFLHDSDLLDLFAGYRRRFRIILQCHFSHPRELTPEARSSLAVLQQQGCLLTSQIALIRGVNDMPETLCDLYTKLHQEGVTPQYLFHPRPVQYATHFQLPIVNGLSIVSQVRQSLSGPLKRFRYVLANKDGKLELVGLVNHKTGQPQLVVRWHQARIGLDLQDSIQLIPLSNKLDWLDSETMNAYR